MWRLSTLLFVVSIALTGQATTPRQPANSCLARETWEKLAAKQRSNTQPASSAALSADGTTLVVATKDGVFSRIVAYDVVSGHVLWSQQLDDPADLLTMAADNSQIAARAGTHCKGIFVRHWILQSGKELPPLAEDGSFAGQVWPSSMAFGGDSVAAAAAISGDLQIWNAKSGQTTNTIEADVAGIIPHQGFAALAPSTSGEQVLAGGWGRICRWEIPKLHRLPDLTGFGSTVVTHLIVSGDGND